MTLTGKVIDTPYGKGVFEETSYVGGGFALLINDCVSGERIAMVTVNLGLLEGGEFRVKTWAENECLIQPLLDTGYFVDTGKTTPTGFVDAAIWRKATEDELIENYVSKLTEDDPCHCANCDAYLGQGSNPGELCLACSNELGISNTRGVDK